MMRIDLSEDQYRTLIKLAFLGNWLANAWRTSDREYLHEYEEVEQLIYAQAGALGEEMGLKRSEDGEYFPLDRLEEVLLPLIEAYDDDCFWTNLVERLAQRDLEEMLGAEGIKRMPSEERDDAFCRFAEKYGREFDEFGLDNLRLVKI